MLQIHISLNIPRVGLKFEALRYLLEDYSFYIVNIFRYGKIYTVHYDNLAKFQKKK